MWCIGRNQHCFSHNVLDLPSDDPGLETGSESASAISQSDSPQASPQWQWPAVRSGQWLAVCSGQWPSDMEDMGSKAVSIVIFEGKVAQAVDAEIESPYTSWEV